MTVIAKALYEAAQIPASNTTVYTAPASTRTSIDKATVTNTTGMAATITAFVAPSGGVADATNTVISAQSVAAGTAYLCPELVGQVLNPGDFVVVTAGTAAALTFRLSGREVS